MSRFKLLYFVIFIINLHRTSAQISDKRLCADEECKEPISLAKTLLRYSSPDSRILSFAPNVDITIYSKSAGSRADLWGGEINGKRGYIPKHLVRETKVLKKPTLLVDTEFNNETDPNQVPSETSGEKVEPNKVQEAFEVVDGTTIYLSPQDTIAPSSTESPIQSTAVPTAKDSQNNVIATPSSEPSPKNDKSEKIETEDSASKEDDDDGENDDDDEEDEEEGEDEEDDDVEDPEAAKEAEVETSTGPGKSEEESANEIPVLTKTVEPVVEKKVEIPSDKKVEPTVEKKVDTPSDKKVAPTLDQKLEPTPDKKIEPEVKIDKPEVVNKPKIATFSVKIDEAAVKEKILQSSGEETKSQSDSTPVEVASVPIPVPPIQESKPAEIKTENAELPSGDASSQEESKVDSTVEPKADSDTKPAVEEIAPPKDPEEVVKADESIVTEPSGALEEVAEAISTSASFEQKEESPAEQKEEASVPIGAESTSQTTTLAPELEVPKPDDQFFEAVTPNPVESTPEAGREEVKVDGNTIAALPPLGGLFNKIASENAESAEVADAPADNKVETQAEESVEIDPGDTNSTEELNSGSTEASVGSDFSFNDDVDGKVEEVAEESSQEGNADLEEDAARSGIVGNVFSNILSMFGGSDAEDEESDADVASAIEKPAEEVTQAVETKIEDAETKIEDVETKIEDVESPGQDPVTSSEDQKAEEPPSRSLNFHASFDDEYEHENVDGFIPKASNGDFCDASSCREGEGSAQERAVLFDMDLLNFNPDVFLYLVTTATSVLIFLFGYIAFDKSKREGPLVAKINKLEKELLIQLKENQMLQERAAGELGGEVSSELVDGLKFELVEATNAKGALEEQVAQLEKELENSTEVGMELNRMLSEILSSQNGSDVLKANVENLQRQLVEQQATINSVNETLALTNTENHELKLEIELSNKKVVDLQAELDKMCLNILRIEDEKEQQQGVLEGELATYRRKYEESTDKLRKAEEELANEANSLRSRLAQAERSLELKVKELSALKDNVKELKAVKKNDGTLKYLLDVSEIQAELQLLKTENQKYAESLRHEGEAKVVFEKRAQAAVEEAEHLRVKYDEAEKSKVEVQTKLEVLSSYFKDREAQLQREISKHESLWAEQQGEATSTTERIKFMQEQLQNYKSQNESLKQEIMSQEVELKSQISFLEKKAHENWVKSRQAERKLEDAKQEASQLRHRLTLRERALQEEKGQHRLQSPIEQNGDIPVSPLHVESPASPPLLYGARDHITKSPPLPGLPPFLPPPPGVPFMPPPPLHGVPPFIPPPPSLFPGDHRPPPLGRMSSPPLNSRYSPSSRGYSPYDRNSSSPSDSEYGTSPPHHRRGYSPYNNRVDDRRDYKRPPPVRSNGRNMKGGASSGSGNSNESLEKINRQQSKV